MMLVGDACRYRVIWRLSSRAIHLDERSGWALTSQALEERVHLPLPNATTQK
jgi:hypothetical protein